MADSWETELSPRLVGYESWLLQMPCINGNCDVFVSIPLPKEADLPDEPPHRWLLAVGDVSARRESESRLKHRLEAEVRRLAGITTDPASILKTLDNDLFEPNRYACLLVAVIAGDCHELTIARAGHVPPLLRRADRRVESIAEEVCGLPLWIDPEQTYENVTVPIGPGEVVILHSDGVTSVIDHQSKIFDRNSLRLAITQASGGATPVGQSILEAIRRFRQGQAQVDDITLLCFGRMMA
jgi:phosphoserine phosphatase RsbU/P